MWRDRGSVRGAAKTSKSGPNVARARIRKTGTSLYGTRSRIAKRSARTQVLARALLRSSSGEQLGQRNARASQLGRLRAKSATRATIGGNGGLAGERPTTGRRPARAVRGLSGGVTLDRRGATRSRAAPADRREGAPRLVWMGRDRAAARALRVELLGRLPRRDERGRSSRHSLCRLHAQLGGDGRRRDRLLATAPARSCRVRRDHAGPGDPLPRKDRILGALERAGQSRLLARQRR